eukprot:TRINITY_DN9134_c0_g1_i3.p1 TRINITY_DN9134_c0_g1~~TRINITY_DN9134_c0_g1_i3.p1  ORF type:complete len:842 (-),score=173.24 TRINITY_DN9134_c0_g1_i3:427-2952(-)
MMHSPDTTAALEDEAETLLSRMTDAEKVQLLTGLDMWTAGGCARLNLPPLKMSDGPHGMRGCSLSGDPGAPLAPNEIALGATFDEQLIQETAEVIGEDAARRGLDVLLGPCVNMQRLPTFGRHFECFSEDPYLSSRAAVAYIRGVQKHVAACAKHFVCNDQETNRHTLNSVVDKRVLHEVYMRPFEAAVVDGDVESIMCGYNRINGAYCAENEDILQKVLRDSWGFKGWLVSDWYGNQSTTRALNAGLNIEMPGIEPRHYGGYLLAAVRDGSVPMAKLDERCRPVLRTMVRRVARQRARPSSTGGGQLLQRSEVFRRTAAASMVLLKNERGVLPLKSEALRSVAVIGPHAATTTLQGGGSCRVRPKPCKSILKALEEALSPSVEVVHAVGCSTGRSRRTTPEFEALKTFAGCDAAGSATSSMRAFNKVQDLGLTVAAWFSNKEVLRRFLMPILRRAGLRQSDPAEVARKIALQRSRANADKGRKRWYAVGLGIAAVVAAAAVPRSWWARLLPLAAASAACVGTLASLRVCARRRRATLREARIQQAEAAARAADACVLVLGSDGFWEAEGMDMTDMCLSEEQNELADRVLAVVEATGKPAVVVVNVGSPKELPWSFKAPALLVAHYGGEEMGPAVADVLLGRVCPSGRLPTTWPRCLSDVPAAAQPGGDEMPGDAVYREGFLVGYRAFASQRFPAGGKMPAFAFGHGLSYTAFTYSELSVEVASEWQQCDGESSKTTKAPKGLVRATVKNTGKCAGSEVVQVYTCVGDRPESRSLCGFCKTASLAPGSEQVLMVSLDWRALGGWYDAAAERWRMPAAGTQVLVEVGASSADIRLSKIVKIA